LTTQLHNLREQLGPQSELLLRTEEKLREVESEYGNSLQDLSDKDTKIHQSNSVQQRLQKQLKDLKERLRKKEHLLERAAKTLSEYEECFQNARFKEGRRVTVIQRGSENSDVAEQIITSDPSKIVATTQQKSLTGKLKSSGSSTSQKLLEVFVDTPEMASSLKRLREILSVAALGSTAASEDKIAYVSNFSTPCIYKLLPGVIN
jgi:chromosome segregation ATPase